MSAFTQQTNRKRGYRGRSADLLQTQTDSLGALYGTDELALAYGLFNDVAKVFKVLVKTGKKQQL